MVAPCPTSRPHRKSTPGAWPCRRFDRARQLAIRSIAQFKQAFMGHDRWLLAAWIRRFKRGLSGTAAGRPQRAAQQVTLGSAARRREGGVAPAASLGWVDDRARSRVRGRTVNATWSPGRGKVKKRGRASRIDLANLRKTAQDLHSVSGPPPKSQAVKPSPATRTKRGSSRSSGLRGMR